MYHHAASNSLNPDQARYSVMPGLDTNCCKEVIIRQQVGKFIDDGGNRAFQNYEMMEFNKMLIQVYSKTCVKRPLLKRPKIVFQDQLLLNEG